MINHYLDESNNFKSTPIPPPVLASILAYCVKNDVTPLHVHHYAMDTHNWNRTMSFSAGWHLTYGTNGKKYCEEITRLDV
jgi:hypothetical protein